MQNKITVTFNNVDDVEETVKAVFRLLQALTIHYEAKADNSLDYFLLQITAYIGNVLTMFGIVDIDQLKDEKNLEDLPDLGEDEDL
jgi:hypothetical protein